MEKTRVAKLTASTFEAFNHLCIGKSDDGKQIGARAEKMGWKPLANDQLRGLDGATAYRDDKDTPYWSGWGKTLDGTLIRATIQTTLRSGTTVLECSVFGDLAEPGVVFNSAIRLYKTPPYSDRKTDDGGRETYWNVEFVKQSVSRDVKMLYGGDTWTDTKTWPRFRLFYTAHWR